MKKRWFLRLVVLMIVFGGALVEAQAQFMDDRFLGFSVDGAIAYTATSESVSGFSIGISHPAPVLPNVGYMGLGYKEDEKLDDTYTLSTKLNVRSFEVYYHVLFPVVSLVIGAGGGLMEINTGIIQKGVGAIEYVNLVQPITEGFVRIGLPFWHSVEFHIGYHAINVSAVDRVKDSDTNLSSYKTKKSYTGGMASIGLLFVLL
ncbi:hypothetical protein WDW89_24350 [Deltaproteobacteria bacterium TL4]